MNTFLELEAGNLTIAAFFILIALIVATRPFVKPVVKKTLMLITLGLFTIIVGGHYLITTDRMEKVKSAFTEGKEIVCENRMNRNAARGLVINQKLDWFLEGDEFAHVEYSRRFHASRCIVK